MSLQLNWSDDLALVARVRHRCYSTGLEHQSRYESAIERDPRARPGDYLVAFSDTEPVGTATSLSLNFYARSAILPAQGVAWVGTVRTHRRLGSGSTRGIASAVMGEALGKARERGQVVTCLMPFRASFYEHFGYGNCEQRAEWTIPLSILPQPTSSKVRLAGIEDAPRIADLHRRVASRGLCDMDVGESAYQYKFLRFIEGFHFIEEDDGEARWWAYLLTDSSPDRTVAHVYDHVCESVDAFRRMLGFIASMRDQYSFARFQCPADLPVNYMLRETQIPHRAVDHPAARVTRLTRMQMRVIDHSRFFSGQRCESPLRASAVIAVREPEGGESRFKLTLEHGRLEAIASFASADVECSSARWASIAGGDLNAHVAARLGLIQVHNEQALALLDALYSHRLPYCHEYF